MHKCLGNVCVIKRDVKPPEYCTLRGFAFGVDAAPLLKYTTYNNIDDKSRDKQHSRNNVISGILVLVYHNVYFITYMWVCKTVHVFRCSDNSKWLHQYYDCGSCRRGRGASGFVFWSRDHSLHFQKVHEKDKLNKKRPDFPLLLLEVSLPILRFGL